MPEYEDVNIVIGVIIISIFIMGLIVLGAKYLQ